MCVSCLVITLSRLGTTRVTLPTMLMVRYTMKNNFPRLRSRLRIWSRAAKMWCFYLLTEFLSFSVTASNLFRQPPLGQSRVYQATQLRTDDVRRQESAGSGSVVFKVARVTPTVYSGKPPHGPISVRPSFPTLIILYILHSNSGTVQRAHACGIDVR